MKIWIIFMHDVLDIPQVSTILVYSEEYVSSRPHTFPNYTYPPLAKCKGKAQRVEDCCFSVEQLKTPSSLTSFWQTWRKVLQSGHPSLFAKQSWNIIQHSTAVKLPINNIWFLSTIFLPSDNLGFLTPHLDVISDKKCYGLIFYISPTKRISFWWVKVNKGQLRHNTTWFWIMEQQSGFL